MANEVNVDINLEIDKANQNLKKISSQIDSFSKDAKKSIGTIDIAIGAFAANLAGAAVRKGFELLSKGIDSVTESISKAVDLAQVQEDAVNRLNVQLQITGNYSKQASKELQDFASSLQKTTTAGDEAILNQLAFAQAMGASVDQSKEIVKAALDMSAALGIDFNAAVRNVSKTLGGYAGELGEVIPELKNLTQEQLRAGEGVKLLSDRFAGAASGKIRTFSGAMAQLNNTQGDFLEKIGEIVTKNPVVVAAINGLNKVFVFLSDFVEKNKVAIQRFINDGLVSMINALKPAAEAVIFFTEIFNGSKNVLQFFVNAGFSAVEIFFKIASAAVESASAIKSFLGFDTSGLDQINQKLEKQIEIYKGAKEAGRQQIQDRIDSQNAFNESLREITAQTVEIINTEIAARQAVTESALQETELKVQAKQQEFDILQALREEQAQIELENQQAKRDLEQLNRDEDFAAFTENLSAKERAQLIHDVNLLKKEGKTNEAKKKLRDAYIKNEESGLASLFSFEKNTNASRAENFKSTLGVISTLSASSNSTLFGIGKAAAISTSVVDGIAAVQKALASAPPPFNFALAAAVGAATAANTAKIASQQPPKFQEGGIVPGSSFSGDNVLARVNSGELILNQAQQNNLAGQLGGNGLVEAIDRLASRPIIIEIDGQEIARATRNAVRDGFRIA